MLVGKGTLALQLSPTMAVSAWRWLDCLRDRSEQRSLFVALQSAGSAHAQRQSLEEIAQDLIAARTVVLVSGLSKQGGEFRLGQREARRCEDFVHVRVLQLEGDTQLFQDHVIGDTLLDGARRHAVVATAQMDDEPIEKARKDRVAARDESLFILLGKESAHFVLVDGERRIGELDDVDHLRVAQVERVADTAQYVVVDHRNSMHGPIGLEDDSLGDRDVHAAIPGAHDDHLADSATDATIAASSLYRRAFRRGMSCEPLSMKILSRSCVVLLAIVLPTKISSATSDQTWLFSIDRWGNAEYQLAIIEDDDGALTGRFGDWPLTGVRTGQSIDFAAIDSHGDRHRFQGTRSGDTLSGNAEYPDTNHRGDRVQHSFRARRLDTPLASEPMTRTLTPSTYSNEFTAHRAPVMIIRPGDVITTTTLDSGGVDHHGKTQALYGNPQTGPFFVAGAAPGDVLAVRIRHLALNRDHADSLDGFAGRAMTPGLAVKSAGLGNRVRWRLDREHDLAMLDDPPERLADFTIPVRPMLGGLGVAPDFGFAPASTGDTGRFGGNMDFNGLVEGVTVFLPVFQPGALLYLGDGHALQGDGEINQWALETSLDVEFSVDVLTARPMATPRLESAIALTVIGQAGSLDDALRSATAGMVQWLEQDYGLDAREASLVIGALANYRVATVAGRNAGMSLSLPKGPLQRLARK